MSDELRTGPSRANIADVAEAAGVSTATVSRALRGHPHVATATRERIMRIAEDLHYVANANAARLASGQSRTIGLLAPLLTSWYTSEIVAGVEELLTLGQYDLLIGTANAVVRERMFRGDVRFHQRIDGVILVDVFCSEEGAQLLSNMTAPVVVLGEQLRSVTSVSVDNAHGARLAARHLIGLGHRHIAVVGGHGNLDVAHNVPAERLEGFRRTLSSAGLGLAKPYVEDGDFTIKGGRRAMHRLLALPQPPTAVFLMSDEMAYGALWALRETGLQVGRDVSVVGFDDHPVAESVGLTTVGQNVREIGRIGARLMLDALGGTSVVHHHPVELELVVRATTGVPPAG